MKCKRCQFDNPAGSAYCSKCGTSLRAKPETADLGSTQPYMPLRLDFEVGSIFADRYQILEELGSGGMGKVFKVMDKEVKEKIAIKILRPEISFDEKTIERFRNELKLARKITHPNICRMYDLVKEKGLYFITMEYISGEDLKSTIMRVGQFSVGKAMGIAREICKGLAEAHKLGVVHRDLKPHNIIIDRDGDVRIMDFGIAHSLKTRGITESGVMIGTPEYMSPEQAVGDEADPRSDIYSLGVILFECLTGTVPFKGDTAVGVALKHKTEPPPNPKSINPQIPDDVIRMVLRCLEKDREKRYQNVGQILEEISTILRGQPTTDKLRPQKLPTTTGQIRTRTPQLRVALLVTGLVVVTAFAGYLAYKEFFVRGDAPSRPGSLPAATEPVLESSAAAAPESGYMDITSLPPGAGVFLDEQPKGTTPTGPVIVDVGKHILKLVMAGHEEEQYEIDIQKDETFAKSYELVPIPPVNPESPYSMKLESAPSGATVRINGELAGKTPHDVKSSQNIIDVEISLAGYDKQTETIKLIRGYNRPRMFNLKASRVRFNPQITPNGATVFLDGKPFGSAPLVNKYVDPGQHVLKVEKEGFNTHDNVITVRVNRTYSDKIALQPRSQVMVHFQASDAPAFDLFIDNKYVGQEANRGKAGNRNFYVDVGSHEFKYYFPHNGEEYKTTHELKPNRTYRITGSCYLKAVNVLDITDEIIKKKIP